MGSLDGIISHKVARRLEQPRARTDTLGGAAMAKRIIGDDRARLLSRIINPGPIPEYRPELGPCWIFSGATTSHGYGNFWFQGRYLGAHVVSYLLLVGPVPLGKELDHLCRVHPCVKTIADEYGPSHLEPVTRRENLLRGQTLAAARAAQTHCKYGHLFDMANTYITARGNRSCRRCHADYEATRRARLRRVFR